MMKTPWHLERTWALAAVLVACAPPRQSESRVVVPAKASEVPPEAAPIPCGSDADCSEFGTSEQPFLCEGGHCVSVDSNVALQWATSLIPKLNRYTPATELRVTRAPWYVEGQKVVLYVRADYRVPTFGITSCISLEFTAEQGRLVADLAKPSDASESDCGERLLLGNIASLLGKECGPASGVNRQAVLRDEALSAKVLSRVGEAGLFYDGTNATVTPLCRWTSVERGACAACTTCALDISSFAQTGEPLETTAASSATRVVSSASACTPCIADEQARHLARLEVILRQRALVRVNNDRQSLRFFRSQEECEMRLPKRPEHPLTPSVPARPAQVAESREEIEETGHGGGEVRNAEGVAIPCQTDDDCTRAPARSGTIALCEAGTCTDIDEVSAWQWAAAVVPEFATLLPHAHFSVTDAPWYREGERFVLHVPNDWRDDEREPGATACTAQPFVAKHGELVATRPQTSGRDHACREELKLGFWLNLRCTGNAADEHHPEAHGLQQRALYSVDAFGLTYGRSRLVRVTPRCRWSQVTRAECPDRPCRTCEIGLERLGRSGPGFYGSAIEDDKEQVAMHPDCSPCLADERARLVPRLQRILGLQSFVQVQLEGAPLRFFTDAKACEDFVRTRSAR